MSTPLEETSILRTSGRYTDAQINSMAPDDIMKAAAKITVKSNVNLLELAKKIGLNATDVALLDTDQIYERLAAAIVDGSMPDDHTAEETEQAKHFTEIQSLMKSAKKIDHKFRINKEGKAELSQKTIELVFAYMCREVVVVIDRFVKQVREEGAENDLRKCKAYCDAWNSVTEAQCGEPYPRTLEQALVFIQYGYAEKIEYVIPRVGDAGGLDLSENEKRSRLSNLAAFTAIEQQVVDRLDYFVPGVWKGLRARLNNVLNRNAKKLFIKKYCTEWESAESRGEAIEKSCRYFGTQILGGPEGTDLDGILKQAFVDISINVSEAETAWVEVYQNPKFWYEQNLTWPLDRELVDIGGLPWTIGNSFTTSVVFGRPGSGKTSVVAYTMLIAMLKAQYGGIIPVPKVEDRNHIEALIRCYGREDDMDTVSLKSEEEQLGNNPIVRMWKRYEDKGEIVPAAQLQGLMCKIFKIAGTDMDKDRGANQTFKTFMESMVMAASNILCIAGWAPTLENISKILIGRAEGKVDPTWWETSFLAMVLDQARWRMETFKPYARNSDVQRLWAQAVPYWTIEIPKGDRPGSNSSFLQNCVQEFTGTYSTIKETPGLRTIVGDKNDWCAADAHMYGAIILVDCSPSDQQHGGPKVGKLAYGFTYADMEREAMDRRGDTNSDDSMRPAFYFVDEYQKSALPECKDLTAEIRDKRYALLFLTQSATALESAFGGSHTAEKDFETFISNAGTLICCQTVNKRTRQLFSDMGATYNEKTESNSGETQSRSISLGSIEQMSGSKTKQTKNAISYREAHFIKDRYFNDLRMADKHNPIVDTIVFRDKKFPTPPSMVLAEGPGQNVPPQIFQFVSWERPNFETREWGHTFVTMAPGPYQGNKPKGIVDRVLNIFGI